MQWTPNTKGNNLAWKHVLKLTLDKAILQKGCLHLEIAVYTYTPEGWQKTHRFSILLNQEFRRARGDKATNSSVQSAKYSPAKRWRKWKKDKEAINLSVKLAEKPEVKRRGDTGSHGADKAEPVTGYPAGPYGAAKAEIVTIYPTYPQAGASSHPRPHPPLHNHQHNPPPPPYYSEIYNRPPNQGYQPFPPAYSQDIGPPNQSYRPYHPPYPQVYYPPGPAYSQDYNIGPPNQGYYQTFPPTYSQGYLPPLNQGYHPYPPPYPLVYSRPPNQGYQRLPPPPYQGYETFQHFASSVGEKVSVDLIENSIGTFFSNGDNDGSYDGGSSF